MMIIENTQERILSVASDIFYKKGLAGARMQEIADQAGINKAMLHYYFKTKEQLFNKVFEAAFGTFVGRISVLLNSDKPLKTKIDEYIDHTIDSLQDNPGITVFVIHELNCNPNLLSELFAGKGNINFTIFRKQVMTEYNGTKNPEMFFSDMVAMCVYPFIAKPIFQKIMEKDEQAFKVWLNERKIWVKQRLV